MTSHFYIKIEKSNPNYFVGAIQLAPVDIKIWQFVGEEALRVFMFSFRKY